MTCVVVKFGGTSVSTIKNIKIAAKRVFDISREGKRVVVVVSAMAGETNRLSDLVSEFESIDRASYDTVVSAGEQVTSGLMTIALKDLGLSAKSLQGWQIPIITTDDFSKARISEIPTEHILSLLSGNIIPVISGFQGVTESKDITTFGRGGSDVTAVALAASLKAESCILYKDVDGILACDPSIVPEPEVLDVLGIEEMFELSSQGAKVVHPRAVEVAFTNEVNLRILPTFNNGAGSSISRDPLEKQSITGIVCNENEVRISLRGMPKRSSVLSNLFKAFANANISIDMILQGENVASNDPEQCITFTVTQSDKDEAVKLIKSLSSEIGYSYLDILPRIAKVSIVGAGLRGHASVADVLYKTISDLGINSYGMATTELKMSVLVSNEYAHQLVRALYANFGLSNNENREGHYA